MRNEKHSFPRRTVSQNDDGLTRWIDEETYENYFNEAYTRSHPTQSKKAKKNSGAAGPDKTQQDPYTVAQNFIDRTEFTF